VVTLRDVAKASGVSTATVSRVIRSEGPVSPGTRELVLNTINLLKFRPNELAQGLRAGKVRTIALAVADIEQGWYSTLTKHLQIALEDAGLDILLFNLDHSGDRLERLIAKAEAMRLHGIVIASGDRLAECASLNRSIPSAANWQLPILAVDQRLDHIGISTVMHDDAAAALTAVEYMLSKYGGPIAFMGRIAGSAIGAQRCGAYRNALTRLGQSVDEALVWDTAANNSYRYVAGFSATDSAFSRGIRFRCILASSDETALGAMSAAADRGLKVPEDLAVIGFGGLEWGRHIRPRLTTMESDVPALAAVVRDFFAKEPDSQTPLIVHVPRFLRLGDSA
jgi:DNA-binding LacI/PurR family transcriptional regulator